MSYRITIKEVAQKAGVSIASVSRFLNNPTSLKENNRQRVERVIKELNYQPLIYARRLAGGKLNTFGLIIPTYEGIFYSFYALEIIRGVGIVLNKEELDLHLHLFWNKDTFNSSLVDGIIFADIIGNDNQLRRLIKEKVPLVVINKKIEDLDISYVAIDNFRGAYEATEFLINHGHKRIAHLAGDINVQCAQERLDGYKAALKKHGIESRDEYMRVTNFSRKEAREQFERLLGLKEIPTALFCCSDEVASEVLSACEEKNINVPRTLSVVGFDDNPNCIYGNAMLTTVRQPLHEMAAQGVKTLKEIVTKGSAVRKTILPPELIVRDTVGFL